MRSFLGAIFLILIHLESFAASLGAAVSWIPYDNRGDFVQNVSVVRTLVEVSNDPQNPSFFKIPVERHFKLKSTASLFRDTAGDSFEGTLQRATQSLIESMKSGVDSSDPFLALVIGSHGGHGYLATQNSGAFDLGSLAQMIILAAEDFHARTGKKLRIEILYAACHSGSLLPALRKLIALNNFKKTVGPITALTSTTTEKVSYGDLQEGDILLKWITQLTPKLEAARTQKEWGGIGPTLGQLGFFAHFGGSSYNHPQYLSSNFNWSDRDTYNFLLVPNPRDTRTIGGREIDNYFHRDLKIDLFRMADGSKNMRQAMALIDYETWNGGLQKNPDRVGSYLQHPQDFVRYAMALFILNEMNGRFRRNESQFEKFRDRAEAIAIDWVRSSQFVSSVKDFREPELFLVDYLRNVKIKKLEVGDVVQILKAIYENFDDLLGGRAMMDFSRRFLLEKYGVQELSEAQRYSRSESERKVKLPDNLPLEFHMLVLRAFHKVEKSVADAELVADILDLSKLNRLARGQNPRRVLPQIESDLSCEKVIGSRISRKQIELLSVDSVTRYDAHEVVNRFRGPALILGGSF